MQFSTELCTQQDDQKQNEKQDGFVRGMKLLRQRQLMQEQQARKLQGTIQIVLKQTSPDIGQKKQQMRIGKGGIPLLLKNNPSNCSDTLSNNSQFRGNTSTIKLNTKIHQMIPRQMTEDKDAWSPDIIPSKSNQLIFKSNSVNKLSDSQMTIWQSPGVSSFKTREHSLNNEDSLQDNSGKAKRYSFSKHSSESIRQLALLEQTQLERQQQESRLINSSSQNKFQIKLTPLGQKLSDKSEEASLERVNRIPPINLNKKSDLSNIQQQQAPNYQNIISNQYLKHSKTIKMSEQQETIKEFSPSFGPNSQTNSKSKTNQHVHNSFSQSYQVVVKQQKIQLKTLEELQKEKEEQENEKIREKQLKEQQYNLKRTGNRRIIYNEDSENKQYQSEYLMIESNEEDSFKEDDSDEDIEEKKVEAQYANNLKRRSEINLIEA